MGNLLPWPHRFQRNGDSCLPCLARPRRWAESRGGPGSFILYSWLLHTAPRKPSSTAIVMLKGAGCPPLRVSGEPIGVPASVNIIYVTSHALA